MAEESKMYVCQVKFTGSVKEFCFPEAIKLDDILGAQWAVSVVFYRPYGLKRKLHLELRSVRARVTFKCENLSRKVLVKGSILMKNTSNIADEENFQHLFEEGSSVFELDVKLKFSYVTSNRIIINSTEKPPIELIGELNFHVSPENYFFFNYKDCNLLSESDLLDSRHQILNELSNEMHSLYKKQEHSDVVLRCEAEIYKAHKAILSSRSPVFAAMFQNPMKERGEGVIDIKDMKPDILHTVLEYLYSGKIAKLDDSTACDLLSAAEQYQLPGLKRACLYYLQSALSVDNVLRTLAFAELYDENLKKKSLDFISREFDRLKNTQEWKTFEKEKAGLAYGVVLNIIEFVNSNNDNVKLSD